MNNINDKKYQNYKKNKALKIILVILALGVITLEILALIGKISMFWGLGLFILIQIIIKFLLK